MSSTEKLFNKIFNFKILVSGSFPKCRRLQHQSDPKITLQWAWILRKRDPCEQWWMMMMVTFEKMKIIWKITNKLSCLNPGSVAWTLEDKTNPAYPLSFSFKVRIMYEDFIKGTKDNSENSTYTGFSNWSWFLKVGHKDRKYQNIDQTLALWFWISKFSWCYIALHCVHWSMIKFYNLLAG